MAKVMMSSREESALWRQRFFEAQAGMERYLTHRYGSGEIARWLPVKAEILSGLDEQTEDDALDDVDRWKRRFFKAQARLERYLAEHHDQQDLEGWAHSSGEVFGQIEPDQSMGAAAMTVRFARQAHCYGSEYEIEHAAPDRGRMTIRHCAIWDYREQARRSGVTLTLESPCTWCTKATAANARAKGCSARYELHADDSGHGCTWEMTRDGSNGSE